MVVAEDVLTLPSLPDFRLEVAHGFACVGSTGFVLPGGAEADVFLFAEMNGDSIERFVKVQESLVINYQDGSRRVG